MGKKHWLQTRVETLLRQEFSQPESWWYFSFADDKGFLGGLFIKTHGVITGTIKARQQKMNPGGEVRAMPCPDESKLPPEEFRNRLLTKEEMLFLGGVQPGTT